MYYKLEIVEQIIPYFKPNIFDWYDMTSDEALVEDAPIEIKGMYDQYIQEIRDLNERGIDF